MAVPNTNTFTLSDVCDELGLIGSNRKLSQCFSSANSNYFNSTYNGSLDRLSNFRDYGSHNVSTATFKVGISDIPGGYKFTGTIYLKNSSGTVIDSVSGLNIGANYIVDFGDSPTGTYYFDFSNTVLTDEITGNPILSTCYWRTSALATWTTGEYTSNFTATSGNTYTRYVKRDDNINK